MLKFLGVMAVCTVLSIFLGPLPFIIVFALYFVMWIVKRR
jgi:hypothetical protein